MNLDLDLDHRTVLVIGSARACRRSLAAYRAAGANVTLVSDQPAPAGARRVDPPGSPDGWRGLLSAADLAVLVEIPPALEQTIRRAASNSSTWISREAAAADAPIGSVTLVGGGPGTAELMTVGALAALRAADIVYFDRLGPRDRLREWAPGAELVDVGKTPGHHAIPQQEIERMLVASAHAGDTVVRLKGGDPFVFGRGGEELAACRAAGVPVSVIPGVSSAVAAPAAAGVPVTYRELSRMFTVVSGHAPLDEARLEHLSGLGGTLVVLMGVGTLPHLSAGLARHGMRHDMPIAIIERAYSDSQRTTVATLATVVATAAEVNVRSPAVIVIGEVVRLAQDDDVSAVGLLQQAAEFGL